jgi:pimeloyl-ACP methyl ester carboxylesterase
LGQTRKIICNEKVFKYVCHDYFSLPARLTTCQYKHKISHFHALHNCKHQDDLHNRRKHGTQQGTSPTPDISPEHFAIMVSDQREAILAGGKGIQFDMTALWQPWGFELEGIRTKVYLWHGEVDNPAPAALAHYIADRVPLCEATFYPGEGHIEPLIKHLDEINAKIISASHSL